MFTLYRCCLLMFCCSMLLSRELKAQQPTAGDCLGAVSVCQLQYNQTNSFIGSGNYPNEINEAFPCLKGGVAAERNSAWYMVTVQESGTFAFTITPNCPEADYDWSLFDLTNATCADIYEGGGPLIACNYSGSTFPTPVTGMNNGTYPQDEPTIQINAGSVFALVVNNWSGVGQCGYMLDFKPAVSLPPGESFANIIDNVPPTLLPAPLSPVHCGMNSLRLSYSEYVRCHSVTREGFRLITPGGQAVDMLSVQGDACAAGGEMEKVFTVTFPPQSRFGEYVLEGFGNVEDNCGNISGGSQGSIRFTIPGFSVNVTSEPTDCLVDNGTATVTVGGGAAPFSYVWDDPLAQTTPTAMGLGEGTYGVRVTDSDGCQAEATAEVENKSNLTGSITAYQDTCSFGKGWAEATVSGGIAPVAYSWNTPEFPNNGPVVRNLLKGNYELVVTDAAGCSVKISFSVPDFRAGLVPAFNVSPATDPIVGIFPTVTFTSQSAGATSFLWDFGDGDFSSLPVAEHVFPDYGTYNVTLYVANEQGCEDSVSRQVNIAFMHTFFAPNAFTPNRDWVNDTFKVVATGIDLSTFELLIIDRWGNVVYHTRNIKQGWTGIHSDTGQECPPGIYIYRTAFVDQSGERHTITGRVMLIY